MRLLIIQTAFIGDVVLATSMIEKLHQHYPQARIDFLLRKGNEALLSDHPYIRNVFLFDRAQGKWKQWRSLISQIRKEKYDVVINAQRFFTSGLLTAFSGGKQRIGFAKNPWSLFFTHRVPHHISSEAQDDHEVKRNHALIASLTDDQWLKPKLHIPDDVCTSVAQDHPYIVVAPASVWFTKQYPKERWIAFIDRVPSSVRVILTGGKGDVSLCENLRKNTSHPDVVNAAGQYSFHQSAALMKGALMNYVNDSAPLHFASAVNAPVTAVFCSTVPQFGFGPLSDISYVLETEEVLTCRPCGLHGKRTCPEGHFRCAHISSHKLRHTLPV